MSLLYKSGFYIAANLFFGLLIISASYGQTMNHAELEENIKDIYGLEKLKALNELSDYYHTKHYRKSIKYGRQAVILGENIFDKNNTQVEHKEKRHLLRAYFQIGEIAYENENYMEAWRNLDSAFYLGQRIEIDDYRDKTKFYLDRLQEKKDLGIIKDNVFNRTIGNLGMKEVLKETTTDVAISGELNQARFAEKRGDFQGAIKRYNKAINLLRNKGDSERIQEIQLKIAILYDSLQQFEEASKFLTEALKETEDIDTASLNEDKVEVIDLGTVVIKQEQNLDSLKSERESLKALSESFAREKDYEKSLEYYKRYLVLTQKMETDSIERVKQRKRREAEILLLKQQKQIADLNLQSIELDKEKQIRLRNTSALIAVLVLLSTLIIFYFYISKRKEHKMLQTAYTDLDNTKVKLEKAEKRIVKLLSQQVSPDIAQELITNSSVASATRRFVCVMFLDIREFTPMAEKLSPEELIEYQNNVFGFMIDIVQKRHGNINQLLGDGFMATFGAPMSHGNDCQNAYEAAREILDEINIRNTKGVIPNTRIGIGLHAGNVVTGNVGNEERKQYSVTGNPVIIASRVEQLNKKYQSSLILTEEVVQELAKESLPAQDFVEVTVKGRSRPIRILRIS